MLWSRYRCRSPDTTPARLPYTRPPRAAFHAGTPQPQPDFFLALAAASATQQASTSFGAGPPQQPEDFSSPGLTCVEQMPVSGRTKRTSSAAGMSPAMAAVTDL